MEVRREGEALGLEDILFVKSWPPLCERRGLEYVDICFSLDSCLFADSLKFPSHPDFFHFSLPLWSVNASYECFNISL